MQADLQPEDPSGSDAGPAAVARSDLEVLAKDSLMPLGSSVAGDDSEAGQKRLAYVLSLLGPGPPCLCPTHCPYPDREVGVSAAAGAAAAASSSNRRGRHAAAAFEEDSEEEEGSRGSSSSSSSRETDEDYLVRRRSYMVNFADSSHQQALSDSGSSSSLAPQGTALNRIETSLRGEE
ncbi:hypothetical protein Efla_000981 [Eimeria flavescens]